MQLPNYVLDAVGAVKDWEVLGWELLPGSDTSISMSPWLGESDGESELVTVKCSYEGPMRSLCSSLSKLVVELWKRAKEQVAL